MADDSTGKRGRRTLADQNVGTGASKQGGGGAELLSADAVMCNMLASPGIGTEIPAYPTIETSGRCHRREFDAKTD